MYRIYVERNKITILLMRSKESNQLVFYVAVQSDGIIKCEKGTRRHTYTKEWRKGREMNVKYLVKCDRIYDLNT